MEEDEKIESDEDVEEESEEVHEEPPGPQLAWFDPDLPWKKILAFFVSTAGGVGLLPKAPGTFGSAFAVVLFFSFSQFSLMAQILILLGLFVVGLWSIRVSSEHVGVSDDPRIVIDEVIGMWLTLFSFPPSLPYLITGFFVFRLLDIVKPFPANWVDQNWKGEKGVMMDDVISGIYSQAFLRILTRVWMGL